jgi:hypothetical protein
MRYFFMGSTRGCELCDFFVNCYKWITSSCKVEDCTSRPSLASIKYNSLGFGEKRAVRHLSFRCGIRNEQNHKFHDFRISFDDEHNSEFPTLREIHLPIS